MDDLNRQSYEYKSCGDCHWTGFAFVIPDQKLRSAFDNPSSSPDILRRLVSAACAQGTKVKINLQLRVGRCCRDFRCNCCVPYQFRCVRQPSVRFSSLTFSIHHSVKAWLVLFWSFILTLTVFNYVSQPTTRANPQAKPEAPPTSE